MWVCAQNVPKMAACRMHLMADIRQQCESGDWVSNRNMDMSLWLCCVGCVVCAVVCVVCAPGAEAGDGGCAGCWPRRPGGQGGSCQGRRAAAGCAAGGSDPAASGFAAAQLLSPVGGHSRGMLFVCRAASGQSAGVCCWPICVFIASLSLHVLLHTGHVAWCVLPPG